MPLLSTSDSLADSFAGIPSAGFISAFSLVDPVLRFLIEELGAHEVVVESERDDKTLIGCILGSAGPIWFVVNEEELVATVIDTALKAYVREGRLPVQKL